ncbi:MAG: hypothetical protein AAB421_05700 [Patescibacteria group bacterium]
MNDAVTILEGLLEARPLQQYHHHTPTRFEPDDQFLLTPHIRGAAMPSLARTLREHTITRSVVFCSPYLQIDPMIFWTHRSLGIPHASVAAPLQTPTAVELIKQIEPQCVLATVETARSLLTALDTAGIAHPPMWYLLRNTASVERLASDSLVHYDLHVVPGLSVAYQCEQLATESRERFHLAPELIWSEQNGMQYASTEPDAPLNFSAIPIFRNTTNQKCMCGKPAIAIAP